MSNIEGINFIWTGRGFGNALILAHLTKIVNDNGIKAVFKEHKRVVGLVDVPLYDHEKHSGYFKHTYKMYTNLYETEDFLPCTLEYLKNVSELVGREMKFERSEHNYVPVIFYDMPETPIVDVVMWTRTGSWSPYRNWPYFEELKKLFNEEGITYIDARTEGVHSIELLNYVKRCKLYLGLDTGPSHYVSKFANWKTLIIQSGFSPFSFWAYAYEYDVINHDVPCQHCWINKEDMKRRGVVCQNEWSCITPITAEIVLEKVLRML